MGLNISNILFNTEGDAMCHINFYDIFVPIPTAINLDPLLVIIVQKLLAIHLNININ